MIVWEKVVWKQVRGRVRVPPETWRAPLGDLGYLVVTRKGSVPPNYEVCVCCTAMVKREFTLEAAQRRAVAIARVWVNEAQGLFGEEDDTGSARIDQVYNG